MAQLGFYIDQSKCTGCKGCTISCKDKNDLEVGMNYRRVYSFEEGSYLNAGGNLVHNVKAFYFSISCNHCTAPKCIPSCPTGSIEKREKDGVVVIDPGKCIGSRFCIQACPYGSPQFNMDVLKAEKCDFCIDLQEKGEEPVCVTSCPLRAIEFGPIEELRKKYGNVAETRGMPSSSITKPNLVINAHRDAK